MDLGDVLEGVVAYVEVRSSNDNRSSAICQELRQLGAKVEPYFTDNITHVVFKEGMKRTWNKAVKRGIPLVSVHWLDSCKQNQRRMPEKDFPAILPEETNSPVLKINQNTRWKKMKSMQPCDFDEEIARSAERGEKRRKRVMMANRFKLTEEATPSSSPVPILALETQYRSPLYLPLSRTSSPVPDTPPSLKERLERMRREQKLLLGTEEESPSITPKPPGDKPLQRRLFEKFASGLISTEESSDEDNTSVAVDRLIQSLESNSDGGSQSTSEGKHDKCVTSCPGERPAGKLKSEEPFRVTTDPQAQKTAKDATVIPFGKKRKSPRASKNDKDDDDLQTNVNRDPEVVSVDVKNHKVGLHKKKTSGDENHGRQVKDDDNLSVTLHQNSESAGSALSPRDINVDTPVMKLASSHSEVQNFSVSRKPKTSATSIKDTSCSHKTLVVDTEISSLNTHTKTRVARKSQGSNHSPLDSGVASTSPIWSKSKQKNSDTARESSDSNLRDIEKIDEQPKHVSVSKSNQRRQSKRISTYMSNDTKNTESTCGNTKLSQKDRIENEKFESSKNNAYKENGNCSLEWGKLKPKLTKKKKNLFTESAVPTLLEHPTKASSKQQFSPEAFSSIKSASKCSKSQEKADVSFLFGVSEPNDSNLQENRRKSRRLSSLSTTRHGPASTVRNEQEGKQKRKDDQSCCNISGDAKALMNSKQRTISSLGDSVLKNDTLGTSMSMVYGNDTTVASSVKSPGCRRSIDEFACAPRLMKAAFAQVTHVNKHKVKSDSKTEASNIKTNKSEKTKQETASSKTTLKRNKSSSSMSSVHCEGKPQPKKQKSSSYTSSIAEDELNTSSAAQRVEIAPTRLRHARSLVMEHTILSINKKSPYSLVMTSLHREEQELVYSVVKKLGVFHMTNNVESSTTHVVCGDSRRTLNVVRAIARGCWVLRKEWVLESLEAEAWLLEEDYELEKFPTAKISRIERQNVGAGYNLDLFSKVGPMFVSSASTPPRKELVHLINLCCGHVTGSELRAAVHIGDEHNPEKLVIKPTWILDSIMKLKQLPTSDYIVLAPVSHSQRESSPEF